MSLLSIVKFAFRVFVSIAGLIVFYILCRWILLPVWPL